MTLIFFMWQMDLRENIRVGQKLNKQKDNRLNFNHIDNYVEHRLITVIRGENLSDYIKNKIQTYVVNKKMHIKYKNAGHLKVESLVKDIPC